MTTRLRHFTFSQWYYLLFAGIILFNPNFTTASSLNSAKLDHIASVHREDKVDVPSSIPTIFHTAYKALSSAAWSINVSRLDPSPQASDTLNKI